MKLRVLIVVIIALLGLFTWWAWPKEEAYCPTTLAGLDSSCYIYYYRGLGLTDNDHAIWGKRYYLISTLWSNGCYGKTNYQGPGYSDFKRFYPDGGIAAEGRCFVELLGNTCLIPDEENVQRAKYYKPDGTLASKVEYGTGTITYWRPKGIKKEEMEVAHFKVVRRSYWDPNGQLLATISCINGFPDGPGVLYYSSGGTRAEGFYSEGVRTGKWIMYNEDGSVSKIEDYTDPASQSE
jgi:hypothetical protein